LIAHRDSPSPAGNVSELEVSVGIAEGKHEIFAVRISQANPALGPGKGIARTARIEPLIRGAAQPLNIDLSRDGVCARADRTGGAEACADILCARVDDRRVGKADGHVISGRPVLLEVAGLGNADEGIVRMLPIECVGLDPLLAASNPVRPRVGLDAEFVRHKVGNDRLSSQRG